MSSLKTSNLIYYYQCSTISTYHQHKLYISSLGVSVAQQLPKEPKVLSKEGKWRPDGKGHQATAKWVNTCAPVEMSRGLFSSSTKVTRVPRKGLLAVRNTESSSQPCGQSLF